jgi:hypothetical protein
MRKFITFCSAVLLLQCLVYSQKVRFGLTASPLFSWYKIDNASIEGDGSRFGFQYGLLVDFNIGEYDRYAFSTGMLVSHNGGNWIASDTANKEIVAIKSMLQYLEIPLTLKLKSNDINYILFYGQFGVTPSVNIRARGDIETTIDTAHFFEENVKVTDFNIFNMSLSVATGIEYQLTENTSLVAGIFFNNGFLNLFKDDDDDKITLNNLGIRFAVMF